MKQHIPHHSMLLITGSEEGVKVDEVKQARVSLNAMRRQHLEKVRQQEEEQALLARMQMEQKLALLRQQKNEQLTFQRELENKHREEIEEQASKQLKERMGPCMHAMKLSLHLNECTNN